MNTITGRLIFATLIVPIVAFLLVWAQPARAYEPQMAPTLACQYYVEEDDGFTRCLSPTELRERISTYSEIRSCQKALSMTGFSMILTDPACVAHQGGRDGSEVQD